MKLGHDVVVVQKGKAKGHGHKGKGHGNNKKVLIKNLLSSHLANFSLVSIRTWV